MQVIPVIDLKDGLVVHAKQGLRAHYQPIKSKLCQDSRLESFINAFNQQLGFSTFYIADLDALTKQGNHTSLIKTLLTQYPEFCFWVDNGEFKQNHYLNYQTIIGSESLLESQINLLKHLDNFVLSLDFFNNNTMGAKQIFTQTDLWPEKIILMTLDQVGRQTGPDYQTIESFVKQYPTKEFIAAGGIRNKDDLLRLEQLGITKALVATALHNGAITAKDLEF